MSVPYDKYTIHDNLYAAVGHVVVSSIQYSAVLWSYTLADRILPLVLPSPRIVFPTLLLQILGKRLLDGFTMLTFNICFSALLVCLWCPATCAPLQQLCRRKQAYPDLANVEVDKLRVLVCHIAPKISAHEAVPPRNEERHGFIGIFA